MVLKDIVLPVKLSFCYMKSIVQDAKFFHTNTQPFENKNEQYYQLASGLLLNGSLEFFYESFPIPRNVFLLGHNSHFLQSLHNCQRIFNILSMCRIYALLNTTHNKAIALFNSRFQRCCYGID